MFGVLMKIAKRSRPRNDKSIRVSEWRECCSLSSIIDGQCVAPGRRHTLHSDNSISFSPWPKPINNNFEQFWRKIGKRLSLNLLIHRCGPQCSHHCSVQFQTKTKRKMKHGNVELKLNEQINNFRTQYVIWMGISCYTLSVSFPSL